jgi:hypothetical protein
MDPAAMDDVDEFERKLTRKKTWNYVALGAVGAVVFGVILHGILKEHAANAAWEERQEEEERQVEAEARKGAETPADRAIASTRLDAIAAESDRLDTTFAHGVTAAFATPPSTDAQCMVPIPASYTLRGDTLVTTISSVQRGTIEYGRQQLEEGHYPDAIRNAPDPADEKLRYDLVLDVSSTSPPRVIGDGLLVPGSLEGRALIWDSFSGKVVCFADHFSAESSEEIHYETTVQTDQYGLTPVGNTYQNRQDAERAAKDDLVRQVRIAVSAELRAVH